MTWFDEHQCELPYIKKENNNNNIKSTSNTWVWTDLPWPTWTTHASEDKRVDGRPGDPGGSICRWRGHRSVFPVVQGACAEQEGPGREALGRSPGYLEMRRDCCSWRTVKDVMFNLWLSFLTSNSKNVTFFKKKCYYTNFPEELSHVRVFPIHSLWSVNSDHKQPRCDFFYDSSNEVHFFVCSDCISKNVPKFWNTQMETF